VHLDEGVERGKIARPGPGDQRGVIRAYLEILAGQTPPPGPAFVVTILTEET
jgi:hypothetical protein